jgi:SAM-dependent methyltransferase
MAHQDFEKYAKDKMMNGDVPDTAKKIFGELFKDLDLSSKKILDFGCGDGKYFEFFKLFFDDKNIFGTEVSRSRIARCKKAGFEKAYYVKPGNELAFSDNFFDFINMDQVLEHIKYSDTDFYLAELNRVLKNDGKLVLVVPNYPIKRLYDLLNGIKKKDLKRIFFDDAINVSFYNPKKIQNRLESHFKYVKVEPAGGLFYKLIPKKIMSHKLIATVSNRKV